jgi:hypothetical protein
MGFEVNRFQGEVDEELVCPICSGVLEDPLQVRKSKRTKSHCREHSYQWVQFPVSLLCGHIVSSVPFPTGIFIMIDCT